MRTFLKKVGGQRICKKGDGWTKKYTKFKKHFPPAALLFMHLPPALIRRYLPKPKTRKMLFACSASYKYKNIAKILLTGRISWSAGFIIR